ncbi:hybrid sensor histidine kinase/response regulator [Prosthecobacter sp.]|uniref:hybrid sensor histidine kinase/response regulator n=1 Tax=Prosthecobacter sp. TaxID=1965333 RepID=UPI002489A549|nr:hybrid sensor histidine kinase/response regulator [Prosthecobacter sp.]MDI1312373.1 response regulator [Prosthecobacter sp.]
MAEKNEFLGNIGHELRNPLSNIIAQAETLLEDVYGPLERAQKSAVSAIQDSAQQLLQLISDVVDLGRLEAGASPLTKAACSVSEICASSLAMVAGLGRSRSIEIVTEVQPSTLGVLADARRLQQILTELLSAAALSMHTGGQLRLRISHDEGCLKLQTLGLAGQPAFESVHLLSRLGKLKPIGLALLQQLVQLHGGTFAVDEAAVHDAGMTVRLPLSRSSAEVSAEEPCLPEASSSIEPPLPASRRQRTILIADDQTSLVAVTRNYLESVGFQVITARDGGEAVQLASMLQPDLILMDVRMPVVDGLSAIRQIRASTDLKTRDIAIVSLSGHASASDKENCLAAGATAYLNKPFGVRELDRIIAAHICSDAG